MVRGIGIEPIRLFGVSGFQAPLNERMKTRSGALDEITGPTHGTICGTVQRVAANEKPSATRWLRAFPRYVCVWLCA